MPIQNDDVSNNDYATQIYKNNQIGSWLRRHSASSFHKLIFHKQMGIFYISRK